MKILSIVLCFSLGLLISACGFGVRGDGNVTEIDHPLEDFDRVALQGMFEVELIEGKSGVEVITDSNLHDYITITVNDGQLKIGTEDRILASEKLLLRISCPSLGEVQVNGAVELYAKESIEVETFVLDVSGAVDADLDLMVKDLVVRISGGGDLHLSGAADDVKIGISGAGEVDAATLTAQKAAVRISGAGKVNIDVVERLDVSISGAGDVNYTGEPEVSKSISGAGSVKKS